MNKRKKLMKKATVLICTMIFIMAVSVPVMASEVTTESSGDPVQVVNNLNNLIYGFIKAIGIGFAAFGFYQFGTSIPSHDAGQRGIGIASICGGLIMIFAKQIMNTIGAS